jgi:eukaryotic-like serine/threonine-protein kinase
VIGRKLGNRYEVIERLGGGGMAVVYRGIDTLLNRNVSIKVLRSQYVGDEEFVRRFRREAQAAASLSHPNIVNIYDVGQDEDIHYIVMEYVDGCTLKERIESQGVLDPKEAVQIAKQICEALEHAHAHNIVHRDIKPHNILISKEGRVKVTDFGIARAITANTITHNGTSVMGSVHYFSPEQARGGFADVKSDVYSLGVVLYEMVTGRVPFTGDSPISVALKHLQEDFVEPRTIRPEIPQSVENIILKSLIKEPALRYQSAREMYRDLDRAFVQPNVPKFVTPSRMEDQTTLVVPPVVTKPMDRVAGDPKQSVPGSDKQDKHAESKRFWRPVIWLFVILVVLVVGSIGGYLAYNNLFFKVPTVTVPNVVGQTYDNAVVTLQNAGFAPRQIHKKLQPDDKAPANQVIAQDPDQGMNVKQDRDITLTVSSGPKQITIPDVTGKSQSAATQALLDAGLGQDHIKVVNQASDQVPKGNVISMDPNSGQITTAQTVTLYVSSGAQMVSVPDVTGKPYSDAINQLQQAGFSPNVVQNPSFKVKAYTVIKTIPAANESAPKGSKIDVYVSSGIPPEAHEVIVDVDVTVDPAKAPINVRITYTDPTGTDVQAVNERISKDTTYPIKVYTMPNQMASIKVYQDGKLTDTKTIPYQ